MSEKIQDWLVRYGYILRKRNTDKGKEKFLKALISDISIIREDISVIDHQSPEYKAKNVYVGDLKKASKVVVTYYDTPLTSFGSYHLFDFKDQKKKTLNKIILQTVIVLLVGLASILLLISNDWFVFDINNIKTYILIVFFIAYFYGLGKVSKGLGYKHTLVRNTSSIVLMLSMMSMDESKDSTYVFVDGGTFGLSGLRSVEEQVSKNTEIVYLDSIGAPQEIRIINNEKSVSKNVKVITASRYDEETKTYYLTKEDLSQKQLSEENMNQVIQEILDIKEG